MTRRLILTQSDSDPQPVGRLEALVAEWPYLTTAEKTEIALRLAYWLNAVRPPKYDEVVINPLIIGDESDKL